MCSISVNLYRFVVEIDRAHLLNFTTNTNYILASFAFLDIAPTYKYYPKVTVGALDQAAVSSAPPSLASQLHQRELLSWT